ncbi:MAG: type II secretion system protein [Candidatus Omnitrophota bacterium]
MIKNKKIAFTLIELVITILLIGILAGIGMVNYFGRREKAINNEAAAILQLICAAEKDIFESTKIYRSCATTEACNTELGLSIPYSVNRNWNFRVENANADNFFAVAQRSSSGQDVLWLNKDCQIHDMSVEGRGGPPDPWGEAPGGP